MTPNGARAWTNYAGLIVDSKDHLYGVTSAVGNGNDGVVFEVIW